MDTSMKTRRVWSRLSGVSAFTLALLTLSPSVGAQSGEPPGFEGFDRFVEEQLAVWKVPGAAVAVVRDGEILFVKGYGYRNLEKKLPMTGETALPIGSIAKSMTAITLAKLVRDAKLAWDRPVREWVPEFRLADESVAAHVTLRDMLIHRTSFIGHDWAWYGAPQTPAELFRKLRHFELRGGLRERFQYSDIMYAAAGHVAATVANTPWEDLVRRDIFAPLGMKSTGFKLADLVAERNHAAPYGHDASGHPTRFEPVEANWVGPGGGFVYASVEDMARYVAMLANGGSYRGNKVLETTDLIELTAPRMPMSLRSQFPEMSPSQYAMGFVVNQYRDKLLISHGGTNGGWHTRFAYFPERKSGVFVADNAMHAGLRTVLSHAALDRLAGSQPVDWSTRMLQARDKARADAVAARAKTVQARKAHTAASRSVAGFVGLYTHGGYGSLTISARGDETPPSSLQMHFHGFTSPLQHVHFDVFEAPPTQRAAPFDPLAGMLLQFVSGFDGEIAVLRVNLGSGLPPVEFKKK